MRKLGVGSAVCMLALMGMIGIKPVYAIDFVHEHIPDAQIVGQGRMEYMVWDIYDAALFAPQGRWNKSEPFALQLTYLRNLDGHKIADRAVQEMRALGIDNEVMLATWHTQMREIFPDVSDGDALTGVYTKTGQTVFYRDDMEIGRINDAAFGHAFFSIWLDPETSAPDLRLSLLGRGNTEGENYVSKVKRIGSYGASDNY